MRAPHRHARLAVGGFTLVELVVVMLLVAVLSSVAAARFADRDAFSTQGAADQLVSGLRVAQGMAMAQRQTIYVVLATAPATLSVCLDAACTQPLPTPAGDSTWLANASDLKLTQAASFTFQPDGTPSFAASLQLQVQNASGSALSQTVTVEAVSGHVHSP